MQEVGQQLQLRSDVQQGEVSALHRRVPLAGAAVISDVDSTSAHLHPLLCSKISNDTLEGLVPQASIVGIVEGQSGLVSVLDYVPAIVDLEGPLQ